MAQANRQNVPEAPKTAVLFPFGPCTVRKPDWDMSARDGRDGSKSCAIFNIDVPIVVGGIIVTATMYANYDSKKGELVFQASIPKNVKITDETDKAIFRSHCLNACEAHREWQALQNRAEAVLTGAAVKPVHDKPTRLVRKIGGVAQVVAEAALPAAGAANVAP